MEHFIQILSLVSFERRKQSRIKRNLILILINLLSCERAQNLKNLKQLIPLSRPLKQRLKQEQLSEYTASSPNINLHRILSNTQNKLRCPIVPGNNIRRIQTLLINDLTTTKITDFNLPTTGNQYILRLQIPMRNFLTMYTSQPIQKLIHIILNLTIYIL